MNKICLIYHTNFVIIINLPSAGPELNRLIEKSCGCKKIPKRIGDRISPNCSVCKEVVRYRCTQCKKEFTTLYRIHSHISVRHTEKTSSTTVPCPRCRQNLKSTYLTYHLHICKVEPHLQCPFCAKKVFRKSCLKIHMNKMHKDEVSLIDIDEVISRLHESSKEFRGMNCYT